MNTLQLIRDLSSKKMKAVLDSIFRPGNWTKTLTLDGAIKNEGLFHFDGATNLLHQIMERCPNIKGISFSPRYIDTDVYRFFATALLENRTWKLDYLPAPDKSSLCFPYLWSCATCVIV